MPFVVYQTDVETAGTYILALCFKEDNALVAVEEYMKSVWEKIIQVERAMTEEEFMEHLDNGKVVELEDGATCWMSFDDTDKDELFQDEERLQLWKRPAGATAEDDMDELICYIAYQFVDECLEEFMERKTEAVAQLERLPTM